MFQSFTDDNPFSAPETVEEGSLGTTPYGAMTLTDVLFSFEGRIPRSTYWLAYLGVTTVLTAVLVLAGLVSEDLMLLTMFLALVPAAWAGLALEIKRWHDLGYSGWMCLIGLVPYLGGFIKLAMLGFFPSDGPNAYGPMPR